MLTPTPGNQTKIDRFTSQASKAQTKLDALNSNSTLTSTCSSLTKGKPQKSLPGTSPQLTQNPQPPPPTRAATAPPPPPAPTSPATLSSPPSSPAPSPCSPCKRLIAQAAPDFRPSIPQRGGTRAGNLYCGTRPVPVPQVPTGTYGCARGVASWSSGHGWILLGGLVIRGTNLY